MHMNLHHLIEEPQTILLRCLFINRLHVKSPMFHSTIVACHFSLQQGCIASPYRPSRVHLTVLPSRLTRDVVVEEGPKSTLPVPLLGGNQTIPILSNSLLLTKEIPLNTLTAKIISYFLFMFFRKRTRAIFSVTLIIVTGYMPSDSQMCRLKSGPNITKDVEGPCREEIS